MAYDLAELRSRVRNRLDDEDFEQEYLDRAINYAQWEITNTNKLKFLETTDTLTLVQASYSLAIPVDFREYQYLRLLSPTNQRANLTNYYMDYDNFVDAYIDPSVNGQGQPSYWSEYNDQILFATPADQTYTFRLDYQRFAATLVDDTDVPDIPEEFAELLELGAYMRIAKREDDYEVKAEEQKDYARLLVDLKSAYGRKKGPGGLRRMRVA